MHDWNSAKLYSEKALKAAKGEKILPQKIDYWKIDNNDRYKLIKGYNNLMIIYESASQYDPYNLSKAIISLDCWSEQLEEKWQTWDIDKCSKDFLNAMHKIYRTLSTKEKKDSQNIISNEKKNDKNSIVQAEEEDILQIVYFDFDKYVLSSVSANKIKDFINLNKKNIKEFIIVGHTDTKGTKKYNLNLSQHRAKAVKKFLTSIGIDKKNIKIFAKGEEDLLIKTEDNVAHPANRRAEISLLN